MILAVDTECTGLNLRHGCKPFFVSACDGENVYMWEWLVDPLTREPSINSRDIIQIKGMLARADKIVFHNAKFDITALRQIGFRKWDFDKVHDTSIDAHMLDSRSPKNLTDLAKRYLGMDILPLEKELGDVVKECRAYAKKNYPLWKIADKDIASLPSCDGKGSDWKSDYWLPNAIATEEGLPKEHVYRKCLRAYAEHDALVARLLYRQFQDIVTERRLERLGAFRQKMVRVALAVEDAGVTISQKRLGELESAFLGEVAEQVDIMLSIADLHDYNLTLPKSGNNKSLIEFVYRHLDAPILKKTKYNSNLSLDKEAVRLLLENLKPGTQEYAFIRALSEKRSRDSAIADVQKYRRFWKSTDRADWFVLYPNLNPIGTATGRWSSSEPNEQNISKRERFGLRHCFGPAPGREWWSCDAQNIELRLPAYESGEQELIDLFERSNDPPYYGSNHLLNFHTVYPEIWDKEVAEVGIDKVGPYIKKKYVSTYYQWCKNGGFAVQYGAVDMKDGTADRAFRRAGAHTKLKKRFSKLERLNQKWIDFANRHGYVETIVDPTIDPERGYPIAIKLKFDGRPKETIPLNSHIQGSSAWWMCKAMLRCVDYLSTLVGGYKLIMQIHDELVFDFPYRPMLGNRSVIMKVKSIMEQSGVDIKIPTPVGVEYHQQSWGAGKTIA